MSTDVLEETKISINLGDNWKVMFHNDDTTPMDLVIFILVSVFGKDPEEAYALTMHVHNNGLAAVAEYSSHELAEQKVIEATETSSKFGYPRFKVTAEQ